MNGLLDGSSSALGVLKLPELPKSPEFPKLKDKTLLQTGVDNTHQWGCRNSKAVDAQARGQLSRFAGVSASGSPQAKS
jgi:hypothetical protein